MGPDCQTRENTAGAVVQACTNTRLWAGMALPASVYGVVTEMVWSLTVNVHVSALPHGPPEGEPLSVEAMFARATLRACWACPGLGASHGQVLRGGERRGVDGGLGVEPLLAGGAEVDDEGGQPEQHGQHEGGQDEGDPRLAIIDPASQPQHHDHPAPDGSVSR